MTVYWLRLKDQSFDQTSSFYSGKGYFNFSSVLDVMTKTAIFLLALTVVMTSRAAKATQCPVCVCPAAVVRVETTTTPLVKTTTTPLVKTTTTPLVKTTTKRQKDDSKDVNRIELLKKLKKKLIAAKVRIQKVRAALRRRNLRRRNNRKNKGY